MTRGYGKIYYALSMNLGALWMWGRTQITNRGGGDILGEYVGTNKEIIGLLGI